MASRQEILAELQSRASSGHPDSAMINEFLKKNPQASQGISQIPILPEQGLTGNVGDILSRIGGGKPESSDYSKLIAQEAIKKQFEDPTVRQLREAEIGALSQTPPKGFVRVGKQTLADPNYVNPIEQQKLDEAERVKSAEAESIRGTAEQNLSSIKEAKEGSRFFGPMGKVPTILDPQSVLGLNTEHYADRKEWENNINKLLSQKVVDLIAEMKRVSKTGATGFGQLSEKEGAILREASTALSRDLPPDRAMYYLNEMEKINRKILSGGTQSVQPNLLDNELDSIEAELAQINAQLGQ